MRAIIVVGKTNYLDKDDQRFLKTAYWIETIFKDYFQNKITAGWAIITSESASAVLEKMQDIILEDPEEDICLFYIGHGAKDGWAVMGTSDDIVSYESLRLVFAHHFGCLIFINDCCYGMAGQKALESHNSEMLFLAASPENYLANISIVYNLVWSWLHEQNYQPVAYIAPQMVPEKDCVDLYDNVKRGPAATENGQFVSMRLGSPIDYLMFRSI